MYDIVGNIVPDDIGKMMVRLGSVYVWDRVLRGETFPGSFLASFCSA